MKENENKNMDNKPDYKDHKFSLIDSFFEFAVLITGILYTIWNCVDLFQVIRDKSGMNIIISSAFDIIAKAIPFVILLVILECHEKLSYIEDNLSATTDYIVKYNDHNDDQIAEIYELIDKDKK